MNLDPFDRSISIGYPNYKGLSEKLANDYDESERNKSRND